MAKNYMADIAKMLGVELGEEFRVSGDDTISENVFKIDEKGLIVKECGDFWCEPDIRLDEILCGDIEIIKPPYEPKKGDVYFFVDTYCKCVSQFQWDDCPFDYAMRALNMVYRTQEEAKAHFAEDYKKLTGKDIKE